MGCGGAFFGSCGQRCGWHLGWAPLATERLAKHVPAACAGECENTAGWMYSHCRLACKVRAAAGASAGRWYCLGARLWSSRTACMECVLEVPPSCQQAVCHAAMLTLKQLPLVALPR